MPEMAEVVEAMFSPDLKDTANVPSSKRVVSCNVFSHMTCKGLLAKLYGKTHRNPPSQVKEDVVDGAVKLTG